MDPRGGVDHAGVVCLAGASPPACFGRPVMAAPPYALCCVTNERDRLSVRERENSEICYFLKYE